MQSRSYTTNVFPHLTLAYRGCSTKFTRQITYNMHLKFILKKP